jgi:hypothetical protein
MDQPAPKPSTSEPVDQDRVDVYELRARTIINLEHLLAEARDAQAEIALMRNSTSWRLTEPLRAAGRLGRRLVRGRG